MTNHRNLVILGDFNVVVQDLNNPDSLAFYDTMEALGLVQHIDKSTTSARKHTRSHLHRKSRSTRNRACIHRLIHLRPQTSRNRNQLKEKQQATRRPA